MDNEQPHQELVKCVVVGDTAVGKTRLICARACNKHVSLSQIMTTHVPTVWAIDQYRIYKDVLERSWEMVDGVNVSLRLWDTFGDHEKDRRFAYGRSDVVLLCFSVTSPISLRNCGAMWFPEIRRFCPHTPVILVGCKNDLRFMDRDKMRYMNRFRDKRQYIKLNNKSELVMPDQGRALAHELGIYYYETSVYTYYGVNEVFENAIRAALLARRQQRFWMTNLKRIQRPLLQAPFLPPRPMRPEVNTVETKFLKDMKDLLDHQYYTDMVIICGSKGFSVHRFLMATVSETFHRLLSASQCRDLTRSSSESSMVSSMGEAATGDFNEDTEHLVRPDIAKQMRVWENIKRRSSCQILPITDGSKKTTDMYREINHLAFHSIRVVKCDPAQQGTSPIQTIVTMSKLITKETMQEVINFAYTGAMNSSAFTHEIRQAAVLLGMDELTKLIQNILDNQHFVDDAIMQTYHKPIRTRLKEMVTERSWFTDVTFDLDDGIQSAHKAMLMARCEPMRAMFYGNFRESTARVVSFPGVSMYSFQKLLCFIYSDELPQVETHKCVGLLELANRMCMQELVKILESRIVKQMIAKEWDSEYLLEMALLYLEPAKMYNALRLFECCVWWLCASFDKVYRTKAVRGLRPDTLQYLRENRYPPVWYVKEYDYYQKCMREQRRELQDMRASPVQTNQQTGCLCFTSKNRRNSPPDVRTALCRNDTEIAAQL